MTLAKRPNPLLAQIEARYEIAYQRKLRIANQLGLDAAIIAANEVLHLGKGRANDFAVAYIETVNEIASMIEADGKDDKEIAYSQETIDNRLRQIVGEDNFAPWAVRYQ